MEPLISVVIPVYNLGQVLDACLECVRAQSLSDWEAVCVDDGSRDDSLARLRAFAAEDARIRVLALTERKILLAEALERCNRACEAIEE